MLASRAATSAKPDGGGTAIDEAADEGVIAIGVAGPHPDLIPEVAALASRGDLDLAAAAAVAAPRRARRFSRKNGRWRAPGAGPRAPSHTSMPPEMVHYAIAEGETVVQLTSVGPWEITYVDPADDPREGDP